jgi:hypothetical protein
MAVKVKFENEAHINMSALYKAKRYLKEGGYEYFRFLNNELLVLEKGYEPQMIKGTEKLVVDWNKIIGRVQGDFQAGPITVIIY